MARNNKTARMKFGETAVCKGYCTAEQVDEALAVQRTLAAGGRPKLLIGLLMVQNGAITTGQHIDIVRAHQQAHGQA